MSHAIETEKVVDLPIEKPADVGAAESQCIRHQIDVLRDMPGFQQNEPIASISVLKDRPFEDGGDEDQERCPSCEVWIGHGLSDLIGCVPFAQEPKVVLGGIVMVEPSLQSLDRGTVEKDLQGIPRATGRDNP